MSHEELKDHLVNVHLMGWPYLLSAAGKIMNKPKKRPGEVVMGEETVAPGSLERLPLSEIEHNSPQKRIRKS
ncbi:hypothetical protein MMC13_001235 [Lambiella insularis]|nr:hypothetical protein [Lambiella insularis]